MLFLLWFARSLARRESRIPFDRIAAALGVFLFFSVFSIIFSEEKGWAIRRLSFLFSYLPLFPVFRSMLSEYGREGAYRLSFPLVVGAAASASVGLFQFGFQYVVGVGPAFHLWVDRVLPFFLGSGFSEAVSRFPSLLADIGGHTTLRASAFFPDPHMFAFFMGISLPLAVGMARIGFLRHRFLSLMPAVLIGAADLVSFSRGGYVGLTFGIVTAAFLFVPRGQGAVSRKAVLSVAAFMSILSVFLILDTPVRDRLVSSFSSEEGSNQGRMAMFREAGMHVAKRPFGYGLGNYPLAVKPTAEYREPIYAHDLFLDIATESGVFSAFSFFLAIVFAFFGLVRCRDATIRLAAVSFAVFFGHALFETPLYSVHILPLLMFILALPAACAIESRHEKSIS